jgi:hypothetical protein
MYSSHYIIPKTAPSVQIHYCENGFTQMINATICGFEYDMSSQFCGLNSLSIMYKPETKDRTQSKRLFLDISNPFAKNRFVYTGQDCQISCEIQAL